MGTTNTKFKRPGRTSAWLNMDLSELHEYVKHMPRTYELAQINMLTRLGHAFKKDTNRVIDTASFAKRKIGPGATHKKLNIKESIKTLVRFKTSDSKIGKMVRLGIFSGIVTGQAKKGRRKISNLKNDAFKFKYGQSVARFGQVFTYGGQLPIVSEHQREELHKLGLHIADDKDYVEFPKRDWATPARLTKRENIKKYIQKHFPGQLQREIKSQLKKGNLLSSKPTEGVELPVAKGFKGSDTVDVHDKSLDWILSQKDIEKHLDTEYGFDKMGF